MRDDRLICSTSWPSPDGNRHNRFYALTIRDDRIADIQDCATRPQAERIAYRNYWRAGHGLLRLGASEQPGRGSF